MGAPVIGTIENGYRFKGGDPADEGAWEQAASLTKGDIDGGYVFSGGDPGDEKNWSMYAEPKKPGLVDTLNQAGFFPASPRTAPADPKAAAQPYENWQRDPKAISAPGSVMDGFVPQDRSGDRTAENDVGPMRADAVDKIKQQLRNNPTAAKALSTADSRLAPLAGRVLDQQQNRRDRGGLPATRDDVLSDVEQGKLPYDPQMQAERSWGDAAKDSGKQLVEGAVGIADSVTNLVAPDSAFAAQTGALRQDWYDAQSPEIKAKLQEIDAKVKEAGKEGVWEEIKAAASEYSDPAVAARLAMTNIASIIPGLAVGKVAKAATLAKGATALQAGAAATTAAGATNAVLNGGSARGEAFDALKKAYLAQGIPEAEATERALSESWAAGGVGAAAGFVSGKFGGAEKALLNGASGALGRKAAAMAAGKAFVTEQLGEQVEELSPQLTTNLLLNRIDGRSVTQGLGSTAVQTAIGAGPMSAVGGVAEYANARSPNPVAQPGQKTDEPSSLDSSADDVSRLHDQINMLRTTTGFPLIGKSAPETDFITPNAPKEADPELSEQRDREVAKADAQVTFAIREAFTNDDAVTYALNKAEAENATLADKEAADQAVQEAFARNPEVKNNAFTILEQLRNQGSQDVAQAPQAKQAEAQGQEQQPAAAVAPAAPVAATKSVIRSNVPLNQRGDGLVATILKLTGGKGIAESSLLDITSDTRKSKVAGLFTKEGQADLSDPHLMEGLNDSGYLVRSGEDVSNLIRSLANGEKPASVESMIADADKAEKAKYRNYILEQAEEHKLKGIGANRSFSAVATEVHKLLNEKMAREEAAQDEAASAAYGASVSESKGIVSDDDVAAIVSMVFDQNDHLPLHQKYKLAAEKVNEATNAGREAKHDGGAAPDVGRDRSNDRGIADDYEIPFSNSRSEALYTEEGTDDLANQVFPDVAAGESPAQETAAPRAEAKNASPDSKAHREGSKERTIQEALTTKEYSAPKITLHSGLKPAGKITRATFKALNQVARIFKQNVVYYSSDRRSADGFLLNGTIYINVNSTVSVQALLGHELTHRLQKEMPNAWRAVSETLAKRMSREKMISMYRSYNADESIGKNDAQIAKDLNKDGAIEHLMGEMVSDFAGNQFTDAKFWGEVFGEIIAVHPEGVAKRLIERLRLAVMKMIGLMNGAISQRGFNRAWLKGETDATAADAWLNEANAALKTAYAKWIIRINEQGYQQAQGDAQVQFAASPFRDLFDDMPNEERQAIHEATQRNNPTPDLFSQPAFQLTGQTNKEAAAEKSQKPSEEITKEQADKERDAVPFSLEQESQPKPVGVQGGLFSQSNKDAAKIDDFGEKLGGAKKDIARSEKAALARVADIPQKSWDALGDFWLNVAQHKDLFYYPTTDAKTIEKAFEDVVVKKNPSFSIEPVSTTNIEEVGKAPSESGDKVWAIWDGTNLLGKIHERGNEVWISVAGMVSGSGGGASVYSAVGQYAHNTGKEFIGDPAGFDGTPGARLGEIRRVEHLISQALRYGSTDHVTLGDDHVANKGWKKWNFRENLDLLLKESYANYEWLFEANPKLAEIKFDVDSEQFILNGRPASDIQLRALLGHKTRGISGVSGNVGRGTPGVVRGARIGEAIGVSTAKRAIVAKTILEGMDSSAAGRILDGIDAKLDAKGLAAESGIRRVQYSNPRFVSQLATQIDNVPSRLEVQPATQWRLWLDSNAAKLGIKKDEIEWSGVKDYLAMRGKDKVSKAEIAAFLSENGTQVQDVVLGGLPPIKGANFTLPSETKAQESQRLIQDATNRWEIVQAAVLEQGGTIDDDTNVARAIQLYPGRVGASFEDLNHRLVEPLLERMARTGATMDQIGTYLYALHATERNAEMAKKNPRFPDGGSGMTNADAAQLVANFRALPNFAEIDAVAKGFQALTKRRLAFMVRAGVMSQDQMDAYQAAYKAYVPLKGFEDMDENGKPTGSGKGFSTGNKIDKRALGRESRAGQIIENIVRDFEAGLILAEKANVGRVVKAFVEANPDAKLWEVDNPPVEQQMSTAGNVFLKTAQYNPEAEIQFLENGKPVRVQIYDKILLRAYNNIGAKELDAVSKTFNIYNSWLRQMYTQKNPAWFVLNFLKDQQSAAMYMTGEKGAGFALKNLTKMPKAMSLAWAMYHNKPMSAANQALVNDFRRSGGMTGFAYVGDIEAKANQLQGALAKYQTWGETKSQGMKALMTKAINNKFFDYIEALNTTFENTTRLATFMTAIESGASSKEAAQLAKNVTVNFNVHGEYGPSINAWYLFANAGIQGTRNIGHALFYSPHKAQVWALASGAVMLGVLAGMMGDDDDDLIDDSTRSRALAIKVGDSKVLIPTAYGWGFFTSMGQLIAQAMKHPDKREKIALKMASSAFDHFGFFGNPVAGDELSLKSAVANTTPTAVRPFVQSATNTSSFGGPLYPESQFNPTQPDSEKAWRKTKGSAYDQFAKWMNSVSGGDAAQEGAVSVSPESLKQMTSTLGGGALRLVTDMLSLPVEAANNGGVKAKNVPVLKSFYQAIDVDDYRRQFGEAAANAEETLRVANNYKKAAIKPGADQSVKEAKKDYDKENQHLIAAGRMVTSYRKRIASLRDEEDKLRAEKGPSEVQRLKLAQNTARQIAAVKQFNVSVKKANNNSSMPAR